ncbi:MAG: DCC1-like thiol-disulfide oxidoreductase family protein [Janthinobacterium lividum]
MITARSPRPRTRRPTLYQRFGQVYDKQVDGSGLAVFRIVFCAVQLAEVLHLFYFRHLVFDPVPFLEISEVGFATPLVLWMLTLGLLMLGLYTRAAALANYGFLLVFFASFQHYAYMMTPVYISMGFLFLFLPISRRLSLDRVRRVLRHSTPQRRYEPPTTVSQLAYYVPVVVGIAFVYFDSALYKVLSPMWLAGLGMWETLSLPYETLLTSSWLLNNEFVVKLLGYVTLAFEFFFIFLFPFRKYRAGLMVVGVGLHLGILFTLPVPLFALGFGCIYLLVVPAGAWQRARARRAAGPRVALYYDAEQPFGTRPRLLLALADRRGAVAFCSVQDHAAHAPALRAVPAGALLADVHSVGPQGQVHRGFDAYAQVLGAIAWLRPVAWGLRLPAARRLGRAAYRRLARAQAAAPRPAAGAGPAGPPPPDAAVVLWPGVTLRALKCAGAAAGLVGLCVLQSSVSYKTPLVLLLRRNSGLDATPVGRALARVAAAAGPPARSFFGLADHPIALDEHFAGYTREVAVTYTGPDGVEQFLPLTQPNGLPGAYLSGAIWLRWTHGFVSRRISQPVLEKGIRDFTAFWATQHGVDLKDCQFKVKVKKIAEATRWEPNFLEKQMRAGWHDAGTVTWRGQRFSAQLADIGAL